MPEISKMPSAEEITEMYRKIEQNEKEMKHFEADLKKLISGDKKLASSPLLVGKTPASLAIFGADGTLNITITKKVIDKIMSPEIRDSNGQRTKKSGHFLSESQLVNALENLKNPVMVLKGSQDNSLVAITDIQDDKGQQILVSISLSDNGSVDDVNRITSAYGREGFSDYMKQQINQHKNVLAYNKEKANDLLLSIGVDFPEANTIISFDDSIAYTTANVKYPNRESERDRTQNKPLTGKEVVKNRSGNTTKEPPGYQMNNPILASQVEKRQMKIAKLEDKNVGLTDKIAKNETRVEKQQAKIEDAQKTKAYCKTLLKSAALPQPLQVFFQSMMNRQESKIERCSKKTDDLQDKNNSLKNRITYNNKKIARHTAKKEGLQKVDKFLTNMQSREGRRDNFIQAISDFRKSSLERNSEKSLKLDIKITQKEAALARSTSSVERVQLRNQIAKLQVKLNSVNEKISKLTAMTDKLERLTKLSEPQADKVIVSATENLQASLEQNRNMSTNAVVDTVLDETDKTLDGIDSIIEQDIEKTDTQKKEYSEQTTTQNSNEKQNENHADHQTEKVLDIAALCAAIPIAFAENHDMQSRLVHTTAVFTALAENFNFDDVKSAVAIGIMDRKDDTAISDQAKEWASKLPLTDSLKVFTDAKGSLPLDIKSGYLDIFAKKADSWVQSRQEKTPAVFSRKNIIGSKTKEQEEQPKTPQHDKSLSKKTDQSL